MPLAAEADTAPWRPLRLFSGYRLLVAGLFAIMSFWPDPPPPLGVLDPGVFQWVAVLYAIASAGFLAVAAIRAFEASTLVVVAAFIDIAALTVLMYTSGGLRTGFGMLLAVAVAGAGALTPGRVAFVFPAAATLAILAEQVVLHREAPWIGVQPVYCGIMGAAMFAATLVAQLAARRVQVTEQKVRDREFDLASLAKLNEHIIGRMRAGVLAVDADRNVRLMNTAGQQLLGLRQPVVGQSMEAAVPSLARLARRWQRERHWSTATLEPAASGLRVQASFAALGPLASQGFLVFLEDAARMHEEAQSLKLASLGRMAASIAHEIRNPLSAVTHATQLLNESDHLDPADQRLLNMIGTNAQRMDGIVENVMQISRGRDAEPELLELSCWLDEFVAEFRARRGATEEMVSLDVSPTDLRVRFDPGQLHQVVSNLCDNAWQMSGADRVVAIRAGIDHATERPYLDVADNGPGIAAGDWDSVFEPFFTTRRQGTGLGLYLARELCAGNRASISLMATDSGSRFRIVFSDPRQLGNASQAGTDSDDGATLPYPRETAA